MTRHPWKTGACVGAILGLIVAGLTMYIAWDHNPQSEFHNESGVQWGYWLFLGASWFAPVFIASSLISGGVLSLLARVRTRGAV